jgi:YHS domain-containing protein
MTAARRQRKTVLAAIAARLAPPALAILLLVAAAGRGAEAATTERVISDRLSGLALNGIDPVAYFIEAAALNGNAEHEYRYAGVIWRFRNVGNAAEFVAHPEVYMPRYGGYDPIALGRGVAVPGNPLVWAIVGQRLYLFFDENARTRFLAGPNEAILAADTRWPAVLSTLVE